MKKLIFVFAAVLCCLFPISAMAQTESEAPELDGAVEESTKEDGEYENVFDTLFDKVCEYLPEILSVITLTSSLILAYAYKRGLLPFVSRSLGAIGDAIGNIKDKGEEDGGVLESIDKAVLEGFGRINSAVEEMSQRLESVTEALRLAESRAGDREKLITVINGQIDMLYEVFMSSSLPHFQKEAVGERIAEMREAIAGDDGE